MGYIHLSTSDWFSIVNIVMVGIFSFLIWRATKQSATATKTMTMLQEEIEKERRLGTRRTQLSELFSDLSGLEACESWLKGIVNIDLAKTLLSDSFTGLPTYVSKIEFPNAKDEDVELASTVLTEFQIFFTYWNRQLDFRKSNDPNLESTIIEEAKKLLPRLQELIRVTKGYIEQIKNG